MLLPTIILILILIFLGISSRQDDGADMLIKIIVIGFIWFGFFLVVIRLTRTYVIVYYRQKLTMQVQNGKYATQEYYYFDSCLVRGNQIILYRNNSIYQHLHNPINVHLYTADKNYGFENGYYIEPSDRKFWLYPFVY